MLIVIGCAALLAAFSSCGGSNSAPACFSGTPTTHVQFLNACTDAMSFDSTPYLPLLNSDGTLPPLP
jgi:hypothetical protein